MTIVIVTPDKYQVIRKTIRHLRAQTVRERLEIVVVAPSRKELDLLEHDLECFYSYKVIEAGEIRILSVAKAAAISQAGAPIVAFAEDHCFPDPGWAEALIAAHRQDYAAVGPLMRNANPATSVSWAGLFLHYGCCLQPLLSGCCTSLPWHNTSYKREVLLGYGSELGAMLMVEGLLLDDLRARGYKLRLEPAATTNHVNISVLSSWISHAFWGGRLFGAMRAQKNRWSIWKRFLYVTGFPLIPPVRMIRAVRVIRAAGKDALLPRVIPPIAAGLLPHALGEAAGYALGVGHTDERYSYYETKRILHVTPSDREVFAE